MGKVNHSLGLGEGRILLFFFLTFFIFNFFVFFLNFSLYFWHIVKLASKQVSKRKKKTKEKRKKTTNTYLHTQRKKKGVFKLFRQL